MSSTLLRRAATAATTRARPSASRRSIAFFLPPPQPGQSHAPRVSLRTAAGLVLVTGLGIGAGSLAAVSLSQALDATGLFSYVPDDDDDEDDDAGEDKAEGTELDGGATLVVDDAGLGPNTAHLARRLALEATGDLTLSATVNLHRFDPAARAFQLLQLKGYLAALDDACTTVADDGTRVPVDLDAATSVEVETTREFVRESVRRLEARLAEYYARK
ncbi:hypothetical protein H9P43_003525 [Blastocladiella emersonii ATCC 22665]|nr:hypothetical protein H9P43_003525 [Blastocladiella emersonii ATCC 22665]